MNMSDEEKKQVCIEYKSAVLATGKQAPTKEHYHGFIGALDGVYPASLIIKGIKAAALNSDFITPKAVKEQIDAMQKHFDGHPEPNEAWAIAHQLFDEDETVCRTQQIMTAWAAVQDMDMIAARMSFIDVYKREVAKARANHEPAKWEMTLGFDKERRVLAIQQAAQNGLVALADYSQHIALPAMPEHLALGYEKAAESKVDVSCVLSKLKSMLNKTSEPQKSQAEIDREKTEELKQVALEKMKF